MALGLSIIGLFMTGAVVSGGQLWIQQENLQDALNNAVMTINASGQNSTAVMLSSLVEHNANISSVQILSFSSNSTGVLQASVSAPATLWFWPAWMGTAPAQVVSRIS